MRPPSHPYQLLARTVREHGWPAGLEAWQNEIPESQYYHSRSELALRHTAWKAFFDRRYRKSIVVVDRGCGSALVSLAGDYERMFAVYTDTELMELVQSRIGWLGIRNIEFVLAPDLESAHFPSASLDAAALYGVTGGELTERFLGRLSDWLKPHATTYVAMPRVGRVPLFPGVVRRLKQNFARLQTFRYDMTITEGYELLPLQSRPAHFRGRLANFLAPCRAPGFGIVAAKAEDPQYSFSDILDSVAHALSADRQGLRIQRFLMSYPFGFSLMVEERTTRRRLLIKMPFDVLSISRAQVNYRMLNALQAWSGTGHAGFPRPLLSDMVGGQPFFVEEALDGRPIWRSDLTGKSWPAIMTGALAWITEFHKKTAKPTELRGQLLNRLILTPLERACRALPADTEVVSALRQYLIRAFAGRRLNLVFSHGDYTTDNIFCRHAENQVSGVFDWDLADETGLPLLDVLYFLTASERDRSGQPYGTLFGRSILGSDLPAGQPGLIEQYCRELEIPADLLQPLATMTWIHHLSERMQNPEPGRFPAKFWQDTLDAIATLTSHEIDLGVNEVGTWQE